MWLRRRQELKNSRFSHKQVIMIIRATVGKLFQRIDRTGSAREKKKNTRAIASPDSFVPHDID